MKFSMTSAPVAHVLTFLIGCAFIFVVAACSFQGIKDIKLVSVEVVSIKHKPSSIGYDEIQWDGHGDIPRQKLKIRFSTKTDISVLAATQGYHTGIEAFFCELQNEVQTGLRGHYIYLGDEIVSTRGPKLQENMKRPAIYHAYLSLHRREETNPSIASPAYDLRTDPDDICFRVRGGNMIGMTFHSNTVVIPKEAVVEALAKTVMAPKGTE
ncbi:MAG: hypothetical protein EA357_05140 [Micavibrio sp.]|nr:MAG: hypothetical protein EA357_05140 [Micavibrio sp.]